MDTKACIESICQCTSFEDKHIPNSLIYELIKAATFSPSPKDVENWEFIIVKDRKKIQEIAAQCPKQSWIKEVPCLIVILDKKEEAETLYGEKAGLYCIQSCAAAASLIIVRANELGLATYWIRYFNEKAISRVLDIPGNLSAEIILATGYPKEKEECEFSPIQPNKITHFDKYGNKESKEPFIDINLKKDAVKRASKLKNILRKIKKQTT